MRKNQIKKNITLKLATIFFALLWLINVTIFFVLFFVSNDFFQSAIDQGPILSSISGKIILLNTLIGTGAFLLFSMFLTILVMKRNRPKKKTSIIKKITSFFLFFIYLSILPIYLLLKTWKPNKLLSFIRTFKQNTSKKILVDFTKKTLISLPLILIFLPIWIGGYFTAGVVIAELLGYIAHDTLISGTGSMHPTFPKGEGEDPLELSKQIVSTQGMFPYPNGMVLFGKRYFGHEIQRGDIVIVEDDKTRKITEEMYGDPSGWVKRVIALSGDTLEIRNGIVYLNEEPQKEKYVARARSTFGESFLHECEKVTVPDNSVFVMGDNRTGSGDSREVGFFNIDDIHYALPWKNQEKNLSQNWHDDTNDLEESAKIKLNKEDYLIALNKEREKEGLKPLKYEKRLEESAQKRGESILEFNDFSVEATKSGFTVKKAMNKAKYYNTLWGETFTSGYYETQELLDNQLEFPESKDFIFDKRFQEIGIAEQQGEIDGCPTHVIVQHFGGYVPPNYVESDIKSWEDLLGSLRDIRSGWNDLKKSGDFYDENKEKIDRINQIIDLRINKIADISGTMRANKWLSSAQQDFIKNGDTALYEEQDKLANFLNEQ